MALLGILYQQEEVNNKCLCLTDLLFLQTKTQPREWFRKLLDWVFPPQSKDYNLSVTCPKYCLLDDSRTYQVDG